MILKKLELAPGHVIDYPSIRKAEKKLAVLNLFVVDPKRGVGPTVTVVDPDSDSPYKDVVVTAQEK